MDWIRAARSNCLPTARGLQCASIIPAASFAEAPTILRPTAAKSSVRTAAGKFIAGDNFKQRGPSAPVNGLPYILRGCAFARRAASALRAPQNQRFCTATKNICVRFQNMIKPPPCIDSTAGVLSCFSFFNIRKRPLSTHRFPPRNQHKPR